MGKRRASRFGHCVEEDFDEDQDVLDPIHLFSSTSFGSSELEPICPHPGQDFINCRLLQRLSSARPVVGGGLSQHTRKIKNV